MDLKLQYTEARSDGIFGWVLPAVSADLPGEAPPLCVFVTHAYKQPDGTFRPIVRAGSYDCMRGMHRLDGMTEDFETFEVLGVTGHKGILFHWGNWGSSSKGCFCVGRKIIHIAEDRDKDGAPDEMVTESRTTFARFLEEQAGVQKFRLIVEEIYSTGGST